METGISKASTEAPATTARTRTAARVSGTAGGLFLVLLAAVHVIKPELDPSWRFISEYAIGEHGWVMVVAFLSLALSCATLFIAIRSEARTRGGKVGLAFLLAGAVGLTIAAVFTTDPITAGSDEMTTGGALHGAGNVIGTLSIPIAAALIGRSLRRNPAWSFARRSLLWSAVLTWIGLLVFEVSFAAMVPGRELGPEVRIGWPNRVMIVTYAVWLIVVAQQASHLRKRKALGR